MQSNEEEEGETSGLAGVVSHSEIAAAAAEQNFGLVNVRCSGLRAAVLR